MKKIFIKLIKLFVVLIVIYFITYQITSNYVEIKKNITYFSLSNLFISIVLLLFGNLLFSLGWYKILHRLGDKINFKESNKFWLYSSFGKYVPGRIWQFTGRILLYEKKGYSKLELFYCSVIEQIYYLLSSSFLAIIFLFDIFNKLIKINEISIYLFSTIFLIFGLVFIHPKVLNICFSTISKILKKDKFYYNINYKDSLILFLPFVGGWLSIGIGFCFLARSITIIDFNLFSYLIGASTGSYFLGYIVLLTPSGIGIREGVLTLILNAIKIVDGMGAVLAVYSRLWYISGEILYLFLTFIFTKSKIVIDKFPEL